MTVTWQEWRTQGERPTTERSIKGLFGNMQLEFICKTPGESNFDESSGSGK